MSSTGLFVCRGTILRGCDNEYAACMEPQRPAYLDYAATSPVDPRVAELVMHHMTEEFGNAGSRTHRYGANAAKAVERARAQVASVVSSDPSDVIFTSGATESDNLAILGLAPYGREQGRMHIVSTSIEHKAILEPLEHLAKQGFEVELIDPERSGAVSASQVLSAIRPDTLLVSVMQINNETGVRQPLPEIADGMADSPAYLHTDAAQGFGKELEVLTHPRIDLISISGHKIYAPKGVGALVARRRNRRRAPLQPLTFGGGQERGLRPGTQPVPLIAGLGLAAELAERESDQRKRAAAAARAATVDFLQRSGFRTNGDPVLTTPYILSAYRPGINSEAVILALKDVASISNGSACTSAKYEPSHVLDAMGLAYDALHGSIRISFGPGATVPGPEELSVALRPLGAS